MGRFQGKRILITGGTSGMGLAGALRIVSEGGQVAITGLNEARCGKRSAPGENRTVYGLMRALPKWALHKQ